MGILTLWIVAPVLSWVESWYFTNCSGEGLNSKSVETAEFYEKKMMMLIMIWAEFTFQTLSVGN